MQKRSDTRRKVLSTLLWFAVWCAAAPLTIFLLPWDWKLPSAVLAFATVLAGITATWLRGATPSVRAKIGKTYLWLGVWSVSAVAALFLLPPGWNAPLLFVAWIVVILNVVRVWRRPATA